MKKIIQKIPAKPGRLPSFKIIIINKSIFELTDANDRSAGLGFGDVYELRVHPAMCPGGSGCKSPAGGWILWCCDQPFTFLAFDTNQWGGNVQGWKTIGLWDGSGYSSFAAVNSFSLTATPLPAALPVVLPPGKNNYLPLMALGKKGGICEYGIMIPQQNLKPLPKFHMMQAPGGNTIVRATIILQ